MKNLKRMLSYLRPYKAFLLLILFLAVFSISLSLYLPILIGRAIDWMIGPSEVHFLEIIPLLIQMAIFVLLAALSQWGLFFFTSKLTVAVMKDLRYDLFLKINHVPIRTIDSQSHGDLMSRMINDVDALADGLLHTISQVFSGTVSLLITLFFMLSIYPAITLLVVLLTPLSVFAASFIAKHSYHTFRQQANLQGDLSGFVEEMVSGQKVVKAFSYEDRSVEQFESINQKLHHVGIKAQFFSSLAHPTTRFINTIIYTAVGVSGAIAVIRTSSLSVGQLSSFLIYANQYSKPFHEISSVIPQIQGAFAAASRIFSLLDEKRETPDAPQAKTLVSCKGNVSFHHVFFSYQPSSPLIRNFHLDVASGQKIALVGPTGCGKTTVINLLMRFYDVDDGSISIDGIPIQEIKRNSLRSLFGMVLQDTWLSEGSVFENIAYGRPTADREEVIAASKEVYAHSFIKRLPKGYDTPMTENGAEFSLGERQLIAIARVMLMNPPMLILDEATSSIDAVTEIKIQKAFEKVMHGKTSFIVAHRLSTIKSADLILVMNDGVILEKGTHHQLLDEHGFYSQLYHSQFEEA